MVSANSSREIKLHIDIHPPGLKKTESEHHQQGATSKDKLDIYVYIHACIYLYPLKGICTK